MMLCKTYFGFESLKREFCMPIRRIIFLLLCFAAPIQGELLTLPLAQRPEWVRREGIVMAGSWEPLLFRVRRDGQDGYIATAEQKAAYLREHSPEMIEQLKGLGVNFVMIHCYKGAGLAAERESMADAVSFAKLCRDSGLRVGVYNYSGAFLWEPLFDEVPQAKDWVLLDQNGNPRTYGRAIYRYYWNRNHKGAQDFYRGIIRFAVNDIKADLLHFDNYEAGPGYDANSVERFRKYLLETFTSEQLKEMPVERIEAVRPPIAGEPDNLLRRAWLDFCCRSLADSYYDMSRYARTLHKDVLIECNPGGPGDYIRPPIDHSRLLRGGEAFWDEGEPSGYYDGKLHTRIRTYKVARRMSNIAFTYTTTPLEMAESMAFNLDCLGCICWFEYGKIAAVPGSKALVSPRLAPFISFFHTRRNLLRDAKTVADVAVLRSFPSQVFADLKYARLTNKVEEVLVNSRTCFDIIYNQHLGELNRYRALILAGCIALSDDHIEHIEHYVESGGRLCIVGPVATYNQWLLPREKPAFEGLPGSNVIYIAEDGDILDAIKRLCRDELTLSIQAEAEVICELTEQAGRRLVHIVNYRAEKAAKNIVICMRLPAERHVKDIALVSPERKDEVGLSFVEEDRFVTFTIPQVNTYEIAIITMSSELAKPTIRSKSP
jgi:hypothetical protein